MGITMDLPFAQKRFCSIKNFNNIKALSAYRSNFGLDYGVLINNGPLRGLLSRAVIIINEVGKVSYGEYVKDLMDTPINFEEVFRRLY
jgi:thiol peroxidase